MLCRQRPAGATESACSCLHASCTQAVGAFFQELTLSETELPLIDPSRRSFCTHGCLSAAAVALGAFSAACGGGGSDSTSPGGSGSSGNPLGSATGNVTGRVVSVPVDGSPLATVGGAAVSPHLARQPPGRPHRPGELHDADCRLHARGQPDHQLHGQSVRVHVPRVDVQHLRDRRTGPATRPLTSYPTTYSGNTVTFTV